MKRQFWVGLFGSLALLWAISCQTPPPAPPAAPVSAGKESAGAPGSPDTLNEDEIILYPLISRAKKTASGQAIGSASSEKKPLDPSAPMVKPGKPFLKMQELPSRLSEKHHETIMKARKLYARQQYWEAAALLRPALQDEPGNLFIMEDLARTLFRIEAERPESFRLYKQLVDRLDTQLGEKDRPGVISLDAWFREAYWKLGCLYLDRREYEKAVFEISRALMLIPRTGPHYEQALSYLCEAYYHLGNYRFAQYLGHRVLEINPNNKYVLEYLSKMKEK